MGGQSEQSNRSERSDSGEIENMSFASHISSIGRAGGTDLESIALANVHNAAHDDGVADREAAASAAQEASVVFIVKRFVLTGYPLTLSALAQFSFNTVIISVIGKYEGVEQLGGASLALGLINATGFAFGAGLCGAMETVLSQTYGKYGGAAERSTTPRGGEGGLERNDSSTAPRARPPLFMYGTYAQRMVVILFVVAFPLGVILCYADSLLSLVGESPAVVHYTGIWCRAAMFGIPVTLIFQLIQRYYSCQHVTKPLFFTMLIAALVNLPLQIGFVKMFGFGGSPVAWLLLMIMIVAGLLGYLKYTGLYRRTWGGWDERSLQNIGGLVNIAIPSMGVMLSEWVALEVNSLAAGFAPANDLAAFSITGQVFGVMWGVGSGVMILTCVFVGNAIGEGKPLLARRIAFIGLCLEFCIALLDVLIVLVLDPYIPYLFTSEPEVVRIYSHLMRFVLPYHIFDTFQSTVMGVFRGCELQKLGAIIITTAFCVVGVPLSFLLFFHFKIGVSALWIGPMTGVAVVGCPTYVYILFRYIDWAKLKPHGDDVTFHTTEDVTIEATSSAGRPPQTVD